jgi:hypothetical protein
MRSSASLKKLMIVASLQLAFAACAEEKKANIESTEVDSTDLKRGRLPTAQVLSEAEKRAVRAEYSGKDSPVDFEKKINALTSAQVAALRSSGVLNRPSACPTPAVVSPTALTFAAATTCSYLSTIGCGGKPVGGSCGVGGRGTCQRQSPDPNSDWDSWFCSGKWAYCVCW